MPGELNFLSTPDMCEWCFDRIAVTTTELTGKKLCNECVKAKVRIEV